MENSDSKTRIAEKFTIEFDRIRKDVVNAYIAIGMITKERLDFFRRSSNTANSVLIVVGSQMPTPPVVFQDLFEAQQAGKLKAQVFTRNFFHPKLYVFELRSSWIAFVGSGNFTKGGWGKNEELFVAVEDAATCMALKEKVEHWFGNSKPIDENFIAAYKETFVENQVLENRRRQNIDRLLDKINSNFNIDNVDFTGQFFSRAHHETFTKDKVLLETDVILEERRAVRSKLYRLNDRLVKVIPKAWKMYPHYVDEYIVSQVENIHHHDYKVVALWVGYGRDRDGLKNYGADATPLTFMRMQVIVSYDYVGIWLMPGKQAAGKVDRSYFLEQMKNEGYRTKFYNMLKNLRAPYFIEIAGVERTVDSFDDSDALWEIVQNDNWHYYYFIIGRNYEVGSVELKDSNIVNTVISDFTKFFPLYDMIRDKTFD